jgi:hypothetical protein
MGIAANTPRAAIAPNQKIIGRGSGRTVVTISRAPNAAMLPPPVIKPAPEATVVRALFSSAVKGFLTMPTASATPNRAKAKIAAVIVTPIDQPVLKNTYRLDRHITEPMAMPASVARTVNCRGSAERM